MTAHGPETAMIQCELVSDAISLSESAFRPDGTFPVRIISEGWGSSGYYSKKVLSEAAGLYKKGTKMYLNHPKLSELKERSDRDVTHIAAYFIKESAWWDEAGPYGPGLYQEAKALPNYADWLKEAAPVLGVSHYVLGGIKRGEAGGKSGSIVESINQVLSVDFVSTPGRGGSIGAMYESWRGEEAKFNASDSLSSRISSVRSAIQDKFNDPTGQVYPYVLDVFDDFAVIEIGDRKAVVPYSIDKTGDAPKIIVGDAQTVEQVYQTKESAMADPDTKLVLTESWNEMRERQTLTESKNQELLKENGDLKNQVSLKEADISKLTAEVAQLKESLAKANEKNILAEAGSFAAELVNKAEIPDLAKTRIKESLVRQATVKDGALDKDALKAIAESEIDYAKSLSGSTGSVRGMGSGGTTQTSTLEEAKQKLIESHMAAGMSKEIAEQIVGGL